MEPDAEVLENLQQSDWGNNFDPGINVRLNQVLDRWENAKEMGVNEEPPLFVADESRLIYEEMAEADIGASAISINIFAPDISAEDMARIHEAFSPEYSGIDEPVAGATGSGTRHKVFDPYEDVFRKSHIYVRDGQATFMDYETSHKLSGILAEQDMQEEYERGLLGKDTLHEDLVRRSFYFDVMEHGGSKVDVIVPGWMVESFLQQRGIAYVVKNSIINRSYRYDPLGKRIVFEE